MTLLFDFGCTWLVIGKCPVWLTVVDSWVWFGGAYVFVVLLPSQVPNLRTIDCAV